MLRWWLCSFQVDLFKLTLPGASRRAATGTFALQIDAQRRNAGASRQMCASMR